MSENRPSVSTEKREHYHCPDDCEKPQEIRLEDGRLVCGRCLIRFGETVEMVLCTPEVCDE